MARVKRPTRPPAAETYITAWDAGRLWRTYLQLGQAEAAFRIHKSELSIRPIKSRIRRVVRPDQAQALPLDRLRPRLPERLRPPPSISKMQRRLSGPSARKTSILPLELAKLR